MAYSLANESAIAAANAATALANGGKVRIYAGTVPARAKAALSGNTMLADLPMSATAFAAAVADGNRASATANAITSATAAASGPPTFFRVLTSADAVVFQGSAGGSGSGADMIVSDLVGGEIVAGGTVSISSLVYRQPEQTGD